jgi:hypothetical protein
VVVPLSVVWIEKMSAIPSSMRLEPKPEAINAYRRRCITNATSSNPYPSRGTIKIPLDTAFPGSMLDTSQTQLSFTMNIVNTNPFVDYFNLPKCGANALIKEFRVMVNGNAVEKNPRYGLAFEDAMNKMGINSDPYEFFTENLWCPTESKFHCNMIKPSMVDSMGNPMYRATLFNDAQQRDQLFFGHAVSTVETAPLSTGQINVSGSTFGNWSTAAAAAEAQNTLSLGNQFGVSTGVVLNTAAPSSQTTPGGLMEYFGVLATPLDYVPSDGQSIYNRGNHTIHTPADWPFYQPGIAKPTPKFSHSRWQDIIQFYSNCKNIPIGMYKKWVKTDTDGQVLSVAGTVENGINCFNTNQKEFAPASNAATTSFRVTTPVLSGLLGLLTDKFFPDMLVAAGKMWIEIDLQPKEVALQLLMDPCRRIPGTIRDFVPFSGRPYDGTSTRETLGNLNTRHWLLGRNLALPLADSQSYNTVGYARNSRLCYSEGACTGQVYAGFGKRTFVATSAVYAANPPSYITQGTADPFRVTNVNIQEASSALITQDMFQHNYDLVDTASDLQENLCGSITGIPIPQYYLSTVAYNKKDPRAIIAVASEVEACYGTYLRSAKAQTRRVWSSTNCKAITTTYSSYDTDYNLSNVILYTEQIIVPDEIASQLLLSARNGAISYHTSFINATYNNAPTNDSQNLLLTVTGASVNSVTFVFQSNVQLSGQEAFAYNSFATYNPWTKVDFTPGDFDVGGTYKLYNPLTTETSLGFNLYLKIGNELIPRQPINDIPSFIMETQKGFQTLADYSIQLDLEMGLVPTFSTNEQTSYLQYDVLKDGFFACFVEAKALDDQTLTGNPYLAMTAMSIPSFAGGTNPTNPLVEKGVPARRCPPKAVIENTGSTSTEHQGVLNIYKPLEGNFRMCFNLATFETQSSARCGTPIVNNQLFLQGDKFYFMGHKVDGQTPTVQVTAIYEQDAKIVFEQGGNCLSFM